MASIVYAKYWCTFVLMILPGCMGMVAGARVVFLFGSTTQSYLAVLLPNTVSFSKVAASPFSRAAKFVFVLKTLCVLFSFLPVCPSVPVTHDNKAVHATNRLKLFMLIQIMFVHIVKLMDARWNTIQVKDNSIQCYSFVTIARLKICKL
eukprot:m.66960 g.66960  ORF g.66960 m.66960 type:complete len:149 (-) comp11848_c0_seq3:186-632(-)